MTEILTESFCERCGTRYTFEPVGSPRKPLAAIGTLGRGIRHFVTDPGSSLDEAFAVARSETEQRSTATALEAFHRTFNFCLNCRQYTCSDCWNVVEGRCLTCAPTPETVPAPARRDAPIALAPMDHAPTAAVMIEPAASAAAEQARAEEEAAAAEAAAQAQADARAIAEAEAAAAAAEAETAAAAATQAEVEATALAAAQAAEEELAEQARIAAEQAAARAQASADAAAAAEAVAAEHAARVQAEAAAAAGEAAAQAQLEAEARAKAEAEAGEEAARANAEEAARAAAQAQAEADAHAAAAIAAAAAADAASASQPAEPGLTFEPGRSLDDAIAEYERHRVATGTADASAVAPAAVATPVEVPPAPVEVPPAPIAAPASPVESPSLTADVKRSPVEPIPTAVGQPVPASSVSGSIVWPEPEVAAAQVDPHWPDEAGQARAEAAPSAPAPALPGAAHPCPSCGLSLSASARFCRRCGTPQQVADAPR